MTDRCSLLNGTEHFAWAPSQRRHCYLAMVISLWIFLIACPVCLLRNQYTVRWWFVRSNKDTTKKWQNKKHKSVIGNLHNGMGAKFYARIFNSINIFAVQSVNFSINSQKFMVQWKLQEGIDINLLYLFWTDLQIMDQLVCFPSTPPGNQNDSSQTQSNNNKGSIVT